MTGSLRGATGVTLVSKDSTCPKELHYNPGILARQLYSKHPAEAGLVDGLCIQGSAGPLHLLGTLCWQSCMNVMSTPQVVYDLCLNRPVCDTKDGRDIVN